MFGTRRLYKAIGQGIILPLLIVALVGANSLSAQQQAETRGDRSPALIAGRDAIVTYGLTPEQVQELTKAAAAGAVGPLADRIVDLSNRLGVTQGATLTMLRILDQGDVPLEQLPQKLAEVADQYKKFQAQLAALNPQNPLASGLIEQAQAEIKVGKADSLIKAHQLLNQAKQAQIAAAQQARNLRQKAQSLHYCHPERNEAALGSDASRRSRCRTLRALSCSRPKCSAFFQRQPLRERSPARRWIMRQASTRFMRFNQSDG